MLTVGQMKWNMLYHLRVEVRVKGGMSVTEWHISVLFGLNGDLVGHTCIIVLSRKKNFLQPW